MRLMTSGKRRAVPGGVPPICGIFAIAWEASPRRLTSKFAILSAQDIADYLEGLQLHPRGFNNQPPDAADIFRVLPIAGMAIEGMSTCSRGWNGGPASGAEIEIFTPGELSKLLAAASPRVATCIAIQAFAGVRTAELFRLTWPDIERRPGHIEIVAGKAKTAAAD